MARTVSWDSSTETGISAGTDGIEALADAAGNAAPVEPDNPRVGVGAEVDVDAVPGVVPAPDPEPDVEAPVASLHTDGMDEAS